MFFTRLAWITAVLIFVLSAFQVALGFGIATGFIGPYDAALARYTTASSSGAVIDRGLYGLLLGIAFGAVAEIGYSLQRR